MNRFLVLFIAILLCGYTFAIEGKMYKFEYLTTEDGLSQSTIEGLYQDSRGYIWIGTRDGANVFDGKNFKVFTHNSKDTNSIGEGWVNGFCEDYLGNVWIGTNSGISIYDYSLNKIRRIPRNLPGGSGKISSIAKSSDNKMWFGLSGRYELACYDIDKDEYTIFNFESVNTSPSANIFDILFTKSDRMFLATESDEILEFDREKEIFIAHNYLRVSGARNYKKSIVENEKGELYIGAEKAGVHVYNPVTLESKRIEGLNSDIVKTKVLCKSPTEVWIGTDGGGINVYNPETGKVRLLLSDNAKEQTISENTIFNLMEDRDGNIWVGHYSTGLSIWKKYKEKFLTFKNNPFDPTSLPKSVVTAIHEDQAGRLWIGQDGGGLSLYNPRENNFTTFRAEEGNSESLTTNVIISIAENDEGHLLLGTYQGGVMFFDPESKKVVKVLTTDDGLASNSVWDIFQDSQGRFLFAGLGAGVDVYVPGTDTVTVLPNPGSNVIMKITEDEEGMLWFGTEFAGISVYNPEDSSHYFINTEEGSRYRLTGKDIKSILFCDGCAWIGTIGGGLNKIDFKTDSVTYYSTEDGLSSNSIVSMLVDRSKNLWLSSSIGLMRFNPKTEEVVVFDKTQGTQGNEYKYNAEYKLRSGAMAFGGTDGFSLFHPDSIKNSPITPAVVFTDFKLFNESATIGEKESVLKKHINLTERIVLNHKQKVFSFEFASLDYTAPTKNKYKYMLEGYDEDTIFADNKNYASYTNVRPGKYNFILMASNSDGVWSDEVLEVKVRIKPPFYKTKLFIILFIVLVVYGVNKFVQARIQQNKRDKEVLQGKIDESKKELNERISEIEKQKTEIREREEKEKELRFTNTGIVKFSEIISKDRDNIDKLSADVISTLIDYVEANAGVLYIVNADNEDEIFLYPAAKYCYDTKDEEEVKILSGEGYVGTAYSGKEIVYVDNMPDGKIVLSSGLGEYSIKNIVFIPIINNDECLGIFEIGSIERVEEYKVDFITKIADSLGSVLAIEKANKYTKTMLEQNMQQSEELKAQEEEMRQNMEEMLATQEEYTRQLDEAEKIQEELKEAKKTIEKLQKGK